jgi:glutathione S-transferase
MTKPKFTYFNFSGGRGDASRLALHLSGIEWEDDRFTGKWSEKKPLTPFGGLPVLEIPGKGVLSQSNAILTYIGREHGMHPTDSWEAARHEALMNAVEELRNFANATARDDEDDKKQAREAFASGYLQQWAKGASAEIRGPYVAGEQLNVVDLKLYVALRAYPRGVYDYIPKDVLEPFGKLTRLITAVETHPKVVEFNDRASA